MSTINLQCGERAELHGVNLRFLCEREDGSIDLLVQRSTDLDEPLRELQADNQFLRESLQSYEQGMIPASEREEQLERKCETMAHELARLTAKLEKHRCERITGLAEAGAELQVTADPYQNPAAWEGPAPVSISENCPQCGRYSGGKNPCHKCRAEVMQ